MLGFNAPSQKRKGPGGYADRADSSLTAELSASKGRSQVRIVPVPVAGMRRRDHRCMCTGDGSPPPGRPAANASAPRGPPFRSRSPLLGHHQHRSSSLFFAVGQRKQQNQSLERSQREPVRGKPSDFR
ncbi:hypothetical protein D623_10009550 [Myotis brandtii]|uniref:Uncharacterized protein n=1 Tax=Myotis brandtii TaxID=109478 RepID=S7N232_MYOBR|nr:hypothetical protein D623_10009550 [Myotis brandtii]